MLNLGKTTCFLIYFDNFGKIKLFPWIYISAIASFSNPASRLPTRVSKTQSGPFIISIKIFSESIWSALYQLRNPLRGILKFMPLFIPSLEHLFMHLFNKYLSLPHSLHSNCTKMLLLAKFDRFLYLHIFSYFASPTGTDFTLAHLTKENSNSYQEEIHTFCSLWINSWIF